MSVQQRIIVVLVMMIIGVGGMVFVIEVTPNPSEPMPTLVNMPDSSPQSLNQSTRPVKPDIADIPQIDVRERLLSPEQMASDQYVIELTDDTLIDDFVTLIADRDIAIVQSIEALNRVVVVGNPEDINKLSSSSVVSAEPDYYASALLSVPPSDPFYPIQWNMKMIDAPSGWQLLSKFPLAVQIAVVDTGVCLDHPDLRNQYGDFRWDYVDDDAVPQDDMGHGCGVASVIAAQNNMIGLIGVAPFVEIMPLRVLGSDGIGTYSDISQAIIDATDQGADIINLSLGGYSDSRTLRSAVNYALANDVYVVAATGNDGGSLPLYPARYAGVIAVGSVNQSGTVSTFSNRGEDTLAPGEVIPVTYIDHGYVYQSGTSFASPHVAGVIALELALGKTPVIESGIIKVDVSGLAEPTPTPDSMTDKESLLLSAHASPDRQPTDRWAVHLKPDVDPDQIASELGFINLGQVGRLKNYYIFVKDGTSTSQGLALSTAQVLGASDSILEFAQETIVQRETRVPTDPLYAEQWHLNNTGQSNGLPGVDINVLGAWNDGYDGTGVTIAVVDDGLEIAHPDFSAKYNSAASYDFNGSNTSSIYDRDDDPSHEAGDTGHGTSAGGVAAADDDGSACGVGVAYNAGISGIRLIAEGTIDSQEAEGLSYALELNDIYTNSWGPSDSGSVQDGPGILTGAALEDSVMTGRDGKGTIYIWAGGNGAQDADHSNADGYANSRYTIAVGATDDRGDRAVYSELGANLLVNAPSNPTSSLNASQDPIGIVTTDRLGTAGENNYMGFSNDCTDSFGGTSSAAPAVAGVVALILDANPDLTWRDVQYILMETATKNDPSDSSWITNAAGHDFSLQYGFGTVDATAAVNLAKNWINVQPEVSVSSGFISDGRLMGDGSGGTPGTPVIATHAESTDVTIESVEITLEATHTFRGDLRFTLTSPSGTSMVIYNNRFRDTYNGNFEWTATSMGFWGESSQGTWTVKAEDVYGGDLGTFDGFSIRFNGTQGEFRVTTTTDENNGCTGASCSLREAIIAANAYGEGAIVAVREGTHTLSLVGTTEDSSATGDLDITADIHIVGAGRDLTIVNGNSVDRVFDIFSGTRIEHLMVTGGQSEPSAHGGGIRINSDSTLPIDDVELNDIVISNNTASGNGGGLAVVGTVSNSSLDLFLSNAVIDNNTATHGGGIAIEQNGSVHISETTVTNNQATHGGGIYNNKGSGAIWLQLSAVANNTAQSGGGYYSDNAHIEIYTSTMSGNTATENGGGLFIGSSAGIDSYSTTITQNVADFDTSGTGSGGGLYISGDSDVYDRTITDSIIADNVDQTGVAPDCDTNATSLKSGSRNVIGDTTGCLTGLLPLGLFANYDLLNTDPLLNDLSDYGGYTLIHALQSGSPAIDLGVKQSCRDQQGTDQRGLERGRDRVCDSGAFEYDAGAGSPILPNVVGLSFHTQNAIVTDHPDWHPFDNTDIYYQYHMKYDQATVLAVHLNKSVSDHSVDYKTTDASNPENYVVVRDGSNGSFDTTTCGDIQGDDISVLDGVWHTQAYNTIYLNLNGGANLPQPDSYRLIVCNLVDQDGNAMSGDYVVDFPIGFTFLANQLAPFDAVTGTVETLEEIPQFDSALSEIDVKYYLAPSDPAGDSATDDVTNPNTYRVVSSGTDGTFQTDSCTVEGDDTTVGISDVDYFVGNQRAVVNLVSDIGDGQYRFVICDTLTETIDNSKLDGDWDGIPGGDFVSEFVIFPKPTNITATITVGQVQITWDDLATSETGYSIERRVNAAGNGWSQVGATGANVSTYNDSGVTCDTSYLYRVQALRDTDDMRSGYSDETTITIDCSAMVDPDGLVATAVSSTQVNLTWNDNNGLESVYQIERRISGSSFAELTDVIGNSTSFADTSVICDTAYDYRVRAYRSFDDAYSEYSNIASAVPACDVTAPSGLTVSPTVGQQRLTLNWTDNSDNETQFLIQRSPSGANIWTEIDTVGTDITTYINTGLPCYTNYDYRVLGWRGDIAKASLPSNVASGTTSCSTIPAPSNLTGTISESDIILSWTDNSPDETNFDIQRAVSGSGSWSSVGSVGSNVTTYTDTATVCGGEYDYQVRSYRSGDGTFATSNTINIRQICPPPTAPSNLVLSPLPFTNDMQLDWDDNSTTETNFMVERSSNGTNWSPISTLGQGVTTYTDTDAGLVCYGTYYYRVTAYRSDDGVYSDASNVALGTVWCDPDDSIVFVDNQFSTTVTTNDISNVVGFPQPSCFPGNITHAYVWEMPATSPITLQTQGSTFDTVVAHYLWNGTTYSEVGCNDNASTDGTSALIGGNYNTGLTNLILVGGNLTSSGSIQFTSQVIQVPTATPIPPNTPVPPATRIPNLTTVGIYNAGLWQFRDTNQTGTSDVTVRFGMTLDNSWQPVVGDWNGDGIDGFGLYRSGRWILRDVVSGGTGSDYEFMFGYNEAGWQPVVGDWDGDGSDGVGLYKEGLWMLKDTLSAGDPDYAFRFNPSTRSDAKPITGDWHDEAVDRVGVYDRGRWYLSLSHTNSNTARTFDFGPTDGTWLPIVGDWDEDGDDTIGIFKNGGWRFRNSNTRGNPDFGLSFGTTGWLPIAGYRGDAVDLSILASLPDVILNTSQVTIDPTATPISLDPTQTPTYTVTPIPTLTTTATVTMIPTSTVTPTFTATVEPLVVPDTVSGSE